MLNFRSLALVALAAFALAGCGGSDNGPPPLYTSTIQSDPAFDGDIQETAPATYNVTQGTSANVQSFFAGIDPGSATEYRTFLDFPLGGNGGVPINATIDSAFLDIFVNSLQPDGSAMPLRIELVEFQPPTLVGTDFDRTAQPPLAFIQVTPDIGPGDVGTNVSIDVTPLMIKAQQLGVTDFQLRVMQDLGPGIPVIMEINDSTGSDRSSRAPQLTVNYF